MEEGTVTAQYILANHSIKVQHHYFEHQSELDLEISVSFV